MSLQRLEATPTAVGATALEFSHVGKVYANGFTAVQDFDLSVANEELVAIEPLCRCRVSGGPSARHDAGGAEGCLLRTSGRYQVSPVSCAGLATSC